MIEHLQSFFLKTQTAVGNLQLTCQTGILTTQFVQLSLLDSQLWLRSWRALRQRLFAALRQLFAPISDLATVEVFTTQQRPELSASALICLDNDAQLVFGAELTT